ncbi:hypothetical protein COCON_G00191320 [Conger conger]|uniref:Tudor domain-containing protein n=1 Tax=Conger conger TaxID=82655 RepID=A0A9Q1D3P1_CONCO|nr:hypothetical protein COCON_G00191320 [Conger conger]
MPLRFRSFVPYTLPGVLALIGWWWYISRKKGRITSHDSEEGVSPAAMGLLASPSEGSNGTLERGPHRKPSRARCRVQEEPLLGQEVTPEVPAPLRAAVERADAPASSSCALAAETGGAEAAGRRGSDTGPEEPVEESAALLGPEEEEDVGAEVQLDATQAVATATVDSSATPALEVEEESRGSPGPQTPAPAQASAVRPEPEGEVAAARTAVPCADAPPSKPAPPAASAAATTTSAVALPPSAHTAAVETGRLGPAQEDGEAGESSGNTGEIERLAAGLITEVILAAAQEVLTVSRAEGGDTAGVGAGGRALCQSQKVEEEEESGGVWEPSSSTPVTNGRLCASRDPPPEDGPPSKGLSESGMEEGKSLSSATNTPSTAGLRLSDPGGEELNGFLAPPVWEEPVGSSKQVEVRSPAPCRAVPEATPPSLAKLRAEEGGGVAEDSGCSTCQSEDGVSSEDLLHSTRLSCPPPGDSEDLLHSLALSCPPPGDSEDLLHSLVLSCPPGGSEDLLHISGISRGRTSEGPGDGPGRGPSLEGAGPPCNGKGLNGAGVGNGAHLAGEAEADQSGGSDVNSMDSVDSGCTLGAGDGHSGSTQSSELIIWEIEVPKHLVGRLIGKQGRYVSFLKQSSGAKIYISTLPYTQEFQICHIEGMQQQVDKALALIGKKFKDLDLTNLYAPPPLPLTLPSLPMTSWLLLPNGVTVEVIVVNIVSAGHVFVQQHTHPTYHALRSLDQQMFLCYSQPGTPALPSPAEVGVICAAPAVEGAWWRAQVISFYKDSNEVEIRYVDYGGYDRVKIDTLRQIRSDFVTLPFQGAEVLLDNIAPLPGEERFSVEANSALEEMTRGVALLAQVTNYDNNTGLPLVQMWNMVGDELVSVNRTLAERGIGTWVDSF